MKIFKNNFIYLFIRLISKTQKLIPSEKLQNYQKSLAECRNNLKYLVNVTYVCMCLSMFNKYLQNNLGRIPKHLQIWKHNFVCVCHELATMQVYLKKYLETAKISNYNWILNVF